MFMGALPSLSPISRNNPTSCATFRAGRGSNAPMKRSITMQSFAFRLATIAAELAYARQICTRHNWPTIDVTRRSIEETAAAIVALRGKAR